jgi:hypothetical protein
VGKKVVSAKKSVKEVVSSEAVQPSSATSTTTTASATAVAPAPAVVTTMTDAAVQECNTLLDQVVSKLGSDAPLSADQIRRATKMRKGGAEVIPKILALCQQHGVTQIGSLTAQEMSDQLQRGDALVQVGLRGAVVQKKVKDTAMGAHGRSWQIGMTMYRTLQRMAVDDPEVALGLQPVEEFFQTKRTKGKVRENKKASDGKKLAKEQAAGTAPGATEPVAAAPAVVTTAPAGNGSAVAGSNGVNGAAAASAATPVNGAGH